MWVVIRNNKLNLFCAKSEKKLETGQFKIISVFFLQKIIFIAYRYFVQNSCNEIPQIEKWSQFLNSASKTN